MQMKMIIEESKEREKLNGDLIKKLGSKDDEIRMLKRELDLSRNKEEFNHNSSRDSESKINKLKQENDYLYKSQSTVIYYHSK
jgi:hypothetical protein